MPNAHEWDEAKKMPRELFQFLGKEGMLACICGKPWPAEYTDVPAPEGYDFFHELIMIDEAARCGSGGLLVRVSACILGLIPACVAHDLIVSAVGDDGRPRNWAPADPAVRVRHRQEQVRA